MQGSAPRRVLIVDDNHDSADTLAMLLETLGYSARTAYNGQEALLVARDFQPDAVLLDICLPDMDGYALGQALRQEHPSARLVAVSGLDRAQDHQRSQEAGLSGHLVKPLDIHVLARALEM